MSSINTGERVRQIVAEFAGLSTGIGAVADTDDLFAAGMTSHSSVNVMLGLEAEFELEFPDEYLIRSVFESVRNMTAAVDAILMDAT